MNSPHHTPRTDNEQRVETLLQIAAEFEPETAMPPGLEARALAGRRPKRHRAALPFLQRLSLLSGAVTVAMLVLMFHITSLPEAGAPRQSAAVRAAAYARSCFTSPTTAGKQSPRAIRLVVPASDSQRSLAGKSPRRKSAQFPPPEQASVIASSEWVHRSRPVGRTHDQASNLEHARVAHTGFRVKKALVRRDSTPPVWRTETVETESVGFASPVMLTRQNIEEDAVTVAPAVLTFPVQDSDVFCAIRPRSVQEALEPIHPANPGGTDEGH